jgi:tyrosyl-tRNA synthetase
MYGKLMSIPDSLMLNYFTLLTEVSAEELAEIEAGLVDRTLNPMETKKRLAHLVVALLNDEAAADAAQAEFERVFQRREEPEEAQVLAIALDSDGKANVDITQALNNAGVVASRGEARRLLSQGAIAIDGEVVRKPQVELAEGSLVRVGRHRFLRVIGTDV